MSTKSSKVLIIIGAILGSLLIFLFFVNAIIPKEGVVIEIPTMFNYIFASGSYGQIFSNVIGLTIVFAFQIIIIVLGIIIVVGLLTKKISTQTIVTLVFIDCALLLVVSIMSLCTKSLVGNTIAKDMVRAGLTEEDAKQLAKEGLNNIYLGLGPKLYGGLGIASFITIGVGLAIHKDNI